MKTIPIPVIQPSKKEFLELAQHGNLVPMYAEMSADHQTPVSVYQRLRKKGAKYSFLLESADRTEVIGRYSIIGADPYALFKTEENKVTITEDGHAFSYEMKSDPLAELESYMKKYIYVPSPKLQCFTGGAVGYIGYDTVSFFDNIPRHNGPTLGVADTYFMVVKKTIVFDHLNKRLKLIANAFINGVKPEEAYDKAVEEIHEMFNLVRQQNGLRPLTQSATPPAIRIESNTSQEDYMKMVEVAKEHILSGNIFQVVLSQRFEADYFLDPLRLYRTLWQVNPSPYMFCISFGDKVSIVGSSPEVHVRVTGEKIEIRPIAGTRLRGKTPEEDIFNEKDLLSDPKEIAEHIMLVDLARNDIGRDSEYGSVQVTDKMSIERFSHVMHIVSSIEGKLRSGKNSYDVMRSTFPAGTVSGAPKIQAMKLIQQLEKGGARGIYSGAVGYFGFNGNCDSCIALRTVVLKDRKAYVQAGAGIVADSTPEGEYQECVNKAMGMLRAIEVSKGS